MTILVLGGAGYIGSHTCVELINSGEEDLIVMDNLSNSSKKSLARVKEITGKKIPFIEGDIRNKNDLSKIFEENNITSVIHFAGLKAVSESVTNPLKYYDNNVLGTINLLEVMKDYNCKTIVFSSSATVYGAPESVPIKESFSLSTTNPYGASKLMVEDILRDLFKSDNTWKIAILRYFNPVGSHHSGLIGEDPNDIPNNLIPYISQVAIGKLDTLSIYGDDYDTKDGTGVRDYIHVVDLAKGHLCALESFDSNGELITVNLGTGIGYSVLDMVRSFEEASGQKIKYKIVERRDGDIGSCYSNPEYAKDKIGWSAVYDINDMCADSWNWQRKNPNGYDDK